MATYAFGDLQGCLREFDALLERVAFGAQDELWLVGDLINRGPDSLGTLRRVYKLRKQCRIVLGNHDLHFLAIYFGGHNPGRSDTFNQLLAAPDVDKLAHWLRVQPLLHRDRKQGHVMVHAGIPHIWSIKQAYKLAGEVHRVLRGQNPQIGYKKFFRAMYGNQPDLWNERLTGLDRVRLITNYLTRLRLVRPDGRMDFQYKGALDDAPPGLLPWYEPRRCKPYKGRILFGHWAALDGETSNKNVIALDTGCVWGRNLTAMCLETGERYVQKALSAP